MKHLKTYKIFESMDDIKSDLEDILTDIKDSNPEDYWYFSVDGEQIEGYEKGDYYEVYISFGSDEPTKREFTEDEDVEDDDDEFQSEYNENQISQALIDAIERAINYMEDLEFQYRIFTNTEYSSDPSEDEVSRIDIDDLEVGGYIQENQSIRIQFRK
jgi:hypothetical protein